MILAAATALLAGAGVRIWCVRRARTTGPVRVIVEPYRNDRAQPDAFVQTLGSLHSLLCGSRGAGRTIVLEAHLDRRRGGAPLAWFSLCCSAGLERHVEAALRNSYPNVRLRALRSPIDWPPAVVTLRRQQPIHSGISNPRGLQQGCAIDADSLLGAMAAAGPPATVQLTLRPAPRLVEAIVAAAGARADATDEPRAEVAPGALFWAHARILARDHLRARAIAGALRSTSTVALGAPRRSHAPTAVGLGSRSMPRGPRCLFRAAELGGLWGLPSPDFTALPCLRQALPIAPAPPGISRPLAGRGLLRDEHGSVTVGLDVRRQHIAVVGAVEQGKSSFLVASVRDDLTRPNCAVIVLDPKGDAADGVLSVVQDDRTCTLLDMAAPSCGFNPLAVDAAPDAIADQVVGALRSLFSEGEVRGSSDRYLRNAIIAALGCDRSASLWDVARLLEVGEAGRAARAFAAERLVAMPAYAEVASFLADELPVQLADARATTTAKLDAPANKLARLLNSPAVKRVLANDSMQIDLDAIIQNAEVLVVRGAMGEIGAGNVAVLMHLLLGMLDAALSRVQDRRDVADRRAVALKIDEAPLVIGETFAQTLALKRSAGLETVACWQTDSQWSPELRDQLDALFAHRVLFATASAADARAASGLLLSEFSDQLRGADERTMRLATPDVRLHLPRHTAIVSWTTAAGRERPFIATTLPMAIDRERIARHADRQRVRGARAQVDPRRPPSVFVTAPPPSRPYATAPQSPTGRVQSPAAGLQLPADIREMTSVAVPQSFQELQTVDAAASVRWLSHRGPPARIALDRRDRELLAWLVAARCALTTQVHERTRPGRALTGTQRQLKRLADAGLIARFQLHRSDGGAVPQCCVATDAAIAALGIAGRRAPVLCEESLARMRRDLHVVGWLLAFERCSGPATSAVLGPGRAAIAPVASQNVGVADLALPDGLRPRDFLASDVHGVRRPVARFASVRPDAVIELSSGRGAELDLLVAFDRPGELTWLEAYDHLLSGWWRAVPRYARLGAPPFLVVICDDAAAAHARARSADAVLVATLARIGDDPAAWERPGRERILFVAEQDAHGGSLRALRVAPQPESVRADPEVVAERTELPARGFGPPEKESAPPPWR